MIARNIWYLFYEDASVASPPFFLQTLAKHVIEVHVNAANQNKAGPIAAVENNTDKPLEMMDRYIHPESFLICDLRS